MNSSLLASLANHVISLKKSSPLVVGINGVDGSGKSNFCTNLSRKVNSLGLKTCNISIDNFHNPKNIRYKNKDDLAKAYYFDSFDFKTIENKCLAPIKITNTYPVLCQTTSHDLETDDHVQLFDNIDKDMIVFIEGVFLFRPEIINYIDYKIYLDVFFETIFKRVKIRDKSTLGSEEEIIKKYQEKYIPGQKLYFKECNPKKISDIVIDNNDYNNPRIIEY